MNNQEEIVDEYDIKEKWEQDEDERSCKGILVPFIFVVLALTLLALGIAFWYLTHYDISNSLPILPKLFGR